MVKGKPAQYAFLPELAATHVQQVSVETAQPSLDCSVLQQLQGKTIILGVVDLSTHVIESPAVIAERIRRALPYVNPEQVIVAPDCGMKYLPRDIAFGKLQAMTEAARLVRAELAASLAVGA
jgi:5-methyltetrahydropteroyltriglutamate--homocysteine methyltransferase